jgi:hypothetical protein
MVDVKGGLIMLTEALGPHTLWAERTVAVVDDIWKHAAVRGPWRDA